MIESILLRSFGALDSARDVRLDLLWQVQPTQVSFNDWNLMLFGRPQRSVPGPQPGYEILGDDFLHLVVPGACERAWKY
jgi:hypothetical protein